MNEATPAPEQAAAPSQSAPLSWYSFIKGSNGHAAIEERFIAEAKAIAVRHQDATNRYCCLALFDPDTSISSFEADRIYRSLEQNNSKRDRDVLLMLLSPGGKIEPAYQIAKLCKRFSKERFIVVVPRQAKSAATLIAIGADEIHMGPLSELGPIDPQIGNLPALGVRQALETIATLSEKHPKSSEMFAQYLRMVLSVEQIGYCERISESAVQYAERLLGTRSKLPLPAADIARHFVYEYKHHGFVIDSEEAEVRLGKDIVKAQTAEMSYAEDYYNLFNEVNTWLGIHKHLRLLVEGIVDQDTMILKSPT